MMNQFPHLSSVIIIRHFSFFIHHFSFIKKLRRQSSKPLFEQFGEMGGIFHAQLKSEVFYGFDFPGLEAGMGFVVAGFLNVLAGGQPREAFDFHLQATFADGHVFGEQCHRQLKVGDFFTHNLLQLCQPLKVFQVMKGFLVQNSERN